MDTIRRRAGIAGFLYLLLVAAGPVRLFVIPDRLFVTGDAAATAARIAAGHRLFELGIAADVAEGVLTLLVGLALFRLLEQVDAWQARLMLILGGLMVTPVYLVNSVNDAAALLLSTAPDFLSAIPSGQREALAYLFLRLHHHGEVVGQIFWGLWLFPAARLCWRSGFVPRPIAAFLALNGAGYLATALSGLLAPDRAAAVANLVLPALFGEVVLMLWLLFLGIRGPRAAPAA